MQAGAAYVEAFETVLKNVAKDETVQYVLALLEAMLEGMSSQLRRLMVPTSALCQCCIAG